MYNYSLKLSASVLQLFVSEDGDQTAGSNNLTPTLRLLVSQDGDQAADIITTTHTCLPALYITEWRPGCRHYNYDTPVLQFLIFEDGGLDCRHCN